VVLRQANWQAESRADSSELDAGVALNVIVDLRACAVVKRRLVVSADVSGEGGGGKSQQVVVVSCDALLLLHHRRERDQNDGG
jgi:hypothetical protein